MSTGQFTPKLWPPGVAIAPPHDVADLDLIRVLFVKDAMTEVGIIEFARQWDPQPFHIDAAFSQRWNYGGLIASGLHTMCATLRLWLDLGVFGHCSPGSPGLGETKLPHPVRPGDTIKVITEIVDLRPSASKPDRGLGRDQPAQRACDGAGTTVFLKRRPLSSPSASVETTAG